jgi:hypothetical protein
MISYPRKQSILGPKLGAFWDLWGVWEQVRGPNKQISQERAPLNSGHIARHILEGHVS